MIVWAYWFFGSVLGVFAILEGISLYTGWWPTLSRTLYNISKKYLMVPFLLGAVVGGLAVHFYWICESCPVPPAQALSLNDGTTFGAGDGT